MVVFRSFIVIFLCAFAVKFTFAQTALEVFSPEKKKFFLFVDGLRENETPKFRVKIKNLSEGPHHIKVIFETRDLNNPQLKINLERGKEQLIEVKLYSNLDRKWYGLYPLETRDLKPKIVKKTAADSLSQTELVVAESKADSILKANLPPQVIARPKDTTLTPKDTTAKIEPKTIYNCDQPLHPKGFVLVAKQLENISPDNARIEKLKTIIRSNCLTSIQIMELLQYLDFEVSKLEVAIFAYKYCFDPMNYAFVEDVFEFESSIQELHHDIYAKDK